MAIYSTLAAVDLGSNSFHLQVARVVNDQIYPLDALREPVRLAAGLTSDKRLNESSQEYAIECLHRFGERLRGFDRHAVRAVGTNALRVAKNAGAFLKRAEATLGFPIEIVAGREEARLIYIGVSHSLPASADKRLVIDIGGGSTEFIIGRQHKPSKLESLYMGCVGYSLKYFPGGKITKGGMKRAELAARGELETMAAGYAKGNWEEAVGSSGTARALAEILELNGYAQGGITPQGLDLLRASMIKAGDVGRLGLKGAKADRLPVLPGGLAIMSASLSELGIEAMSVVPGSMREGILYDLLGRFQHHDMRDVTVAQFMQRYRVDSRQAQRVGRLALTLYQRLAGDEAVADDSAPLYIAWAAKLHGIGISVAYSGYHKHSAYILENADMPGFSKMEQRTLSLLVLAHRRSLKRIFARDIDPIDWRMVMALRLAALVYRSRADIAVPALDIKVEGRTLHLGIEHDWLSKNPLTTMALQEEVAEWENVGFELDIASLDDFEQGTEPQAA